MKAAVLPAVDAPFELRDVPDPAGETVIRVRAAGVNFADLLIRRGRYPQMPELPVVLGSEVAGELEDGTRVMALTGTGGYAELAAADFSQVVPLPSSASYAEGASFLLTFLTAYIPLTRQVRLRSGATVLVHAAAGGVGSAAVQVAKALGARVVGAVGSAAKLDLCRELGAEDAYVYERLPDDLRCDVVLDPVGGDLFAQALRRLRTIGTLVAIGFAGGTWPQVNPAELVGRNVGVQGFYLGRLLRHDPEVVREAVSEVVALWETGAVKPLVGAELPLAEVGHAHELLESRQSVGKLVLLP